ncbi:MAG: hypothetical protein WBB84_02205, partial [Candidatus Omnitrophota bacterium]
MSNMKNRYKTWIKTIAMVVVCLFTVNTILWAYPGGRLSSHNSTLQVQSLFKPIMDITGETDDLQLRFETAIITKMISEETNIPCQNINATLNDWYYNIRNSNNNPYFAGQRKLNVISSIPEKDGEGVAVEVEVFDGKGKGTRFKINSTCESIADIQRDASKVKIERVPTDDSKQKTDDRPQASDLRHQASGDDGPLDSARGKRDTTDLNIGFIATIAGLIIGWLCGYAGLGLGIGLLIDFREPISNLLNARGRLGFLRTGLAAIIFAIVMLFAPAKSAGAQTEEFIGPNFVIGTEIDGSRYSEHVVGSDRYLNSRNDASDGTVTTYTYDAAWNLTETMTYRPDGTIEEDDQSTVVTITPGWKDFYRGANLPWIAYGFDIGLGMNGEDHEGFSTLLKRSALYGALDPWKGGYVRVFLFCDLRSGMTFDGSGNPISFNTPQVYADMDALVEAANVLGIKLIPVLFDYMLADGVSDESGYPVGEHQDLITDPVKRAALLALMTDFIRNYAGESAIAAWDVMNEPSISVEKTSITTTQMESFLADLVDMIRTEDPTTDVTIGSMSRGTVDTWTGLDQTFYSIHHYDYMDGDYPLTDPISMSGTVRHTELEPWNILWKISTVYDSGSDGALFWQDASFTMSDGDSYDILHWDVFDPVPPPQPHPTPDSSIGGCTPSAEGDLSLLSLLFPWLAIMLVAFRRKTAIDENVTCGTVCEDGHEGSFAALDEQLKRQYSYFATILGIFEERIWTEEEVDKALVLLGRASSVEQLQGLRAQIRKRASIPDDIDVFFTFPEGNTELFWVEKDYGAGHFNKAGTRIHISLPFINNRGLEAGVGVASHEVAHIRTGKHEHIPGSLQLMLDQAIQNDEKLRIWEEDIGEVLIELGRIDFSKGREYALKTAKYPQIFLQLSSEEYLGIKALCAVYRRAILRGGISIKDIFYEIGEMGVDNFKLLFHERFPGRERLREYLTEDPKGFFEMLKEINGMGIVSFIARYEELRKGGKSSSGARKAFRDAFLNECALGTYKLRPVRQQEKFEQLRREGYKIYEADLVSKRGVPLDLLKDLKALSRKIPSGNRGKRSLYIASGADIRTSIILSEKAEEIVLVDKQSFNGEPDMSGPISLEHAKWLYFRDIEWAKFSEINTILPWIGAKHYLLWELEAMGAEVVGGPEFDSGRGAYVIRFKLPGEDNERKIIYFEIEDANREETYPEQLKSFIGEGIDLYVQKACQHVNLPESIISLIAASLDENGALVIDMGHEGRRVLGDKVRDGMGGKTDEILTGLGLVNVNTRGPESRIRYGYGPAGIYVKKPAAEPVTARIEADIDDIMKESDEYRIAHVRQAIESFRQFIRGRDGFEVLYSYIAGSAVLKRTPDKEEYFRALQEALDIYEGLSEKEKNTLLLAIILHDVGFTREAGWAGHWEEGARRIEPILRRYGIHDREMISNVKDIVARHGNITDFGVYILPQNLQEMRAVSPNTRAQSLIMSLIDTLGKLKRSPPHALDNILSTQALREVISVYRNIDTVTPEEFLEWRLKCAGIVRVFQISREGFELSDEEFTRLKAMAAGNRVFSDIWSKNIRNCVFPLFINLLANNKGPSRVENLYKIMLLFAYISRLYFDSGKVAPETILNLGITGGDFDDDNLFKRLLQGMDESGFFAMDVNDITEKKVRQELDSSSWTNVFGLKLKFENEKILLDGSP